MTIIIETPENNALRYMSMPERLDAGYDIKTPVNFNIMPNERVLVLVPLRWQPPTIPRLVRWLCRKLLNVNPVWVGRILPRSGLAIQQGLDTMAGVIDEGYRGDFGILLYNTNENEITFKQGDKIAQLVLMLAFQAPIEDGEVNETNRGKDGFGSTG